MTEVARAVAIAGFATGAFVLVLVLPGAFLADRIAGRRTALTARLTLSVVLSQLLVGAVGVALIALGLFSGAAMAVAAVVLSVSGLPAAARWVRATARPRPSLLATAGWLVALAATWVWFIGLAGWPPADTLQWYYAGLGSQLAAAGGVPVSVAEWGASIRWLPDYLLFNIDSEAYLALLSFLPRADALAAFRVPMVLLGLGLILVVLRLWLGRTAAIVGVTAIGGSVFFLAKFDAYKPEALGIVIGLAAGWLILRGLRDGRSAWVLVGGAGFGAALSIHVIAATVTGLIVAGWAVGEWIFLTRARWTRLGWLVRAALLGLLISLAMGIGVQGRANVAPAALNPAVVGGTDPTWTFFLRSTGDFSQPPPAPPARPLAGGVTTPWAGLRITSAFGWWFLAVGAIGVAFAFGLGGRKARTVTIGMIVGGLLVGAGIAFFALRFDTYVPRWTGLVRFGQFVPLGAGLLLAVAAEGYLRIWSWLAELRLPRWLPVVAAIVGLAWLVPTAVTRYGAEARLPPPGIAALDAVRAAARSDDVVLTNALTGGTVESFTGLEDPLEGRQPLIEEPALLASTNQLLLDAHEWFSHPTDRALLDRLGVSWVLAVDHPDVLGAPASVGGSVSSVEAAPGLERVWSGDGIALFRVNEPATAAAVHDSRVPIVAIGRAVAVTLVAVLLGSLLVAPGYVLRRLAAARPARRSAA